MPSHRIYKCLVEAVKSGKLIEPFTISNFKDICPGWSEYTYRNFLARHEICNPKSKSDLFVRIERGKYSVVRPFKYGLDC